MNTFDEFSIFLSHFPSVNFNKHHHTLTQHCGQFSTLPLPLVTILISHRNDPPFSRYGDGGQLEGRLLFFLRRIRRLRILFHFPSHPPLRYPVGTSTFFIIVSFFSVRCSCGGQEMYTTQFSIYHPLRDYASCHLAIGMEHDEVGDLGVHVGGKGGRDAL